MNFHHAALISSKVLERSYLDTSADHVEFDCVVLNDKSYELFEKYITGEVINEEISPNVSIDLYSIGMAIGNEFLIKPYLSTLENLQLSIETLPKFFEYSRVTGNHDKLLDFVCKNFYNIDKTFLAQEVSKLGFEFAERMITSDNLTISSEEELAEFILNLAKELNESINLLKYVKTAFIPLTVVDKIIKESRELGLNESDSPALLSFLSEFFENSKQNLPRKSDRELPSNISYIARKEYDDVVNENKVLTAKITKMDNELQELVADLQMSTEFELSKQKILFDRRLSGIKSILTEPLFQSSHRNLDKLKAFQKNSADFNSIYNCFEDFCKKNDTKAILFGVLANFNETRSAQGNNIILEAATRNNHVLAAALVNCSADPICQNSAGDTILHIFVRNGNIEAVKNFVGVMDVNSVNLKKETPLSIAIASNNQVMIDIVSQHDHSMR
ncbi:hypothetical protein TVAG_149730 [Trichomonas vaginalis G3]|uniref:Uncharacterized protein n=1 Tax=Trichomonas vaginalis (strain ATCC PRA-98 / G3) TaxID=412133 RepID=A2FIK6_TRIV3|nr:ankyrin repeat domain-containing protein 61 family [Trichomonas vaginalis G3]EAX95255.1 hypothetical protein TVAG_149730 [Trichomonas vaginalis G3]KAI5531914.1 ankyrin repeat domain-containing protein 61 family [Trichomonas vaginalis G3]|eukprot:XP_001308185.1 hypothetical protein [Trichomonas vaginalis G3]